VVVGFSGVGVADGRGLVVATAGRCPLVGVACGLDELLHAVRAMAMTQLKAASAPHDRPRMITEKCYGPSLSATT
jgi:hypothetical protein